MANKNPVNTRFDEDIILSNSDDSIVDPDFLQPLDNTSDHELVWEVSSATVPVKKSESDGQKPRVSTTTTTTKRTKSVAPPVTQVTMTQNSNDDDRRTDIISATKTLWGTMAKETGKGVVGLLDTNTEAVKLVGGSVGSLNDMIRLIIQNEKQICDEKFDMLSAASKSLTGGVLNVMKSSRKLGGEGAKVMSEALQKATDLGVMAAQSGSDAAGASLGIGNQALKTTTKIFGVPLSWARKQAGKALSSIGVVDDNKVDEFPDEEPPPPRTGTRKVPSKKIAK